MRGDFQDTAESKGLDCHFTFAAYTYRLQTFNDAEGKLARLNLDCEQLPLPLRVYLDDISKQINEEIAQGETVMGIIQKYSGKGELTPGIFAIKNEANSFGMAFGKHSCGHAGRHARIRA